MNIVKSIDSQSLVVYLEKKSLRTTFDRLSKAAFEMYFREMSLSPTIHFSFARKSSGSGSFGDGAQWLSVVA